MTGTTRPHADLESRAPRDPWIETREGGLFFVNALLTLPAFALLVSLAMRGLLRAMGLGAPAALLDPIPLLASFVVPVVGWLLPVPIWLAIRSWRSEGPPWSKLLLALFVAVHVGIFAWTVWWWATGQSFPDQRQF